VQLREPRQPQHAGEQASGVPDVRCLAQWLLGFLEEPRTSSSLLRHRFPSKVGGRPAWLHPLALPTAEQLTCPLTHQPRRFLLQVRSEGCKDDLSEH